MELQYLACTGITIDFSKINFAEVIVDMSKALIIFIMTTLVGIFITNHIVNKVSIIKKNNKHLSDYGIKSIGNHGNAKLSRSEIATLFGINSKKKPAELCFFFMTGHAFFNKYMDRYISKLAKKDCQVKILVGDYHGSRYTARLDTNNEEDLKNVPKRMKYYRDIINGELKGDSFLDRTTAMLSIRDSNSNTEKELKRRVTDNCELAPQVVQLEAHVDELNKQNGNNNIQVRYYQDEYRFPLMIAKYSVKDSKKLKEKPYSSHVWTNLATPVQESRESINVYAKDDAMEDSPFVNYALSSFDYLWERYAPKSK